ncbi:hypothetical protein IU469_22180 [Nocardia puris]|uniref:hypothetical protein n=1 Tax=Nocardia puris TaxID=208602 RepID=UPI001895DA54|nr:hypothetical protein [Nocardia puris]MBF6213750.1 hypothetical protein [Nocardia puris]MBF6368408.1 hypothetical protein [Nocardia puris]
MRNRIGESLRRWADRLDPEGVPRSIEWSFTFERGRGLVFHNNRKVGCPLYYLPLDEPRAYTEENPSPQLMALYERIREASRADIEQENLSTRRPPEGGSGEGQVR